VGQLLISELDQRVVFDRILETARDLTGARYAALGILNDSRDGLERFLTVGIDPKTRLAIGDLPRGLGVLGVLVEHPQPLRLADVAQHPSSHGFPPGHPAMHSFLGVPITIHGRAWGNLYLTEKAHGEFTEEDEKAAVILASWAAIAIENSRLYELSERRREQSEMTSRRLQVARDVAVAVGAEVELERVLELIAERGLVLVHAETLLIWLREGAELVLHAGAGHVSDSVGGMRVPAEGTLSGEVLEHRRSRRFRATDATRGAVAQKLGVAEAESILMVPMLHGGRRLGVLVGFDGRGDGEGFSEEDEQLREAFAASAATAVALTQSVRADRLRSALGAAEVERGRWARELHDETLQNLAGLRLRLGSALRRDDPDYTREAVREASGDVENAIENLRSIITELRPAALDELGLLAAIESLLDRHRHRGVFLVESKLAVRRPADRRLRLDPELESAVYRLLQEALNNVAKHAKAGMVRVTIDESDTDIRIEVRDDGDGFDTGMANGGFGLSGMRERVVLAGGTFNIASGENGTTVNAWLPVSNVAAAGRLSGG
jgi:signal transduction histidine kinase